MSKLHGNAALTVKQHKMIQDLYLEGHPISSLAICFGVNRKTADHWQNENHDYLSSQSCFSICK